MAPKDILIICFFFLLILLGSASAQHLLNDFNLGQNTCDNTELISQLWISGNCLNPNICTENVNAQKYTCQDNVVYPDGKIITSPYLTEICPQSTQVIRFDSCMGYSRFEYIKRNICLQVFENFDCTGGMQQDCSLSTTHNDCSYETTFLDFSGSSIGQASILTFGFIVALSYLF